MSLKIYKDDGTSQVERIHGIIYRKAFGESCEYENVVGEGFGIKEGKLKVFSDAFYLAKGNDLYHDDSAYMNSVSARCMESVAQLWKLHTDFPKRQDYSVQELIALSKCKIL